MDDASDYAIDPKGPPLPRATSLPPAAKTVQVVMHGLRDLAIPAMCLLSIKLGFEQGGWLFAVSVIYTLGGNMGLRKGEGSVDVADIINLLKR